MSIFLSHFILNKNEPVGTAIEARDAEFDKLIERSRLSAWHLNAQPPTSGVCIAVGVTPSWNLYDVVLLDFIDDKLKDKQYLAMKACCFNADICRNPAFLHQFIPELKQAYATPFLGVWENGKNINASYGYNARQWLLNYFDITPDQFAVELGKAKRAIIS